MRGTGLLRQFLEDVRTQRLRTALTILGITWGTVAVVVLLAFGTGLGIQMRKNAEAIGEGVVIVFGGRTTLPYAGFGTGRPIRLREDDVAFLEREVPEIGAISPEYSTWQATVRRGSARANPNVTGVVPVYGELRKLEPRPGGRFLDPLDLAQRRRVAFLGDSLEVLLFGGQDAVGREILIGGVPFTVVGVMRGKQQNSSYNSRDEDRVFIPASTFRSVFGATTINNLVYRPRSAAEAAAAREGVYRALARRHRFDPADRDALSVWDTAEFQKMFELLFLGFNVFLGVVGSFTLTVGGIGVANIMYVVVRERTREIGIKRSVGARRRDILLQFFAESLLIVAAGAALGLAVSWALVRLGAMLPIENEVGTPTISPAVAAATLVLLAGVGFLAGFFPARRAANLDPVECLRQGA